MQNPDKDGRESDNKMLACGYYFLEIKMYITFLYKNPATFNFLLFLCKYILYTMTIPYFGGVLLPEK